MELRLDPDDFLKSITQTLAGLELEFRGKLFPGKINPPDPQNKLPERIDFPHFVGQMNGIPMEIDFSLFQEFDLSGKPQKKESTLAPFLRIYCKLNLTPIVLLIIPGVRNFMDQISQKLGLQQDIPVGIPEIDNSYRIRSDKPEAVITAFQNPVTVSALKRLDGFSRLQFKDSALSFVDQPFEEEKFCPDYLRRTLNGLQTLITVFTGQQ
ncbi:MAG: hypothetical protein PHW04_06210 [Candidatus Wallbacteria bacterium]|nr:hypothetical protein [Candidatus Wallbacteria bacterium]